MSVPLQGRLRSRRVVGAATFLLWALAAAGAVYWVLRAGEDMTAVPPGAVAAGPPSAPVPPDPVALGRLLGAQAASRAGAEAPPPALASRLALTGVVAGGAGGGAALISVDGGAPRPYRLGSAVAAGLVLQSVGPRRAVLAEDMRAAPALTLELPPLPEPVGLKSATKGVKSAQKS